MALILGELREAHYVDYLGREASIQHCCSFSLAQVDAYRRLINVGYLRDSVFQFMGLVSVQSLPDRIQGCH